MFDAEFEQWWKAYPKRVGRIAAKAAFTKVRKSGVPAAVLLEGLVVYRQIKPVYADWCHPTTWLNQGRWMDEPVEAPDYQPWVCPHDPHCPHRAACAIVALRKQA